MIGPSIFSFSSSSSNEDQPWFYDSFPFSDFSELFTENVSLQSEEWKNHPETLGSLTKNETERLFTLISPHISDFIDRAKKSKYKTCFVKKACGQKLPRPLLVKDDGSIYMNFTKKDQDRQIGSSEKKTAWLGCNILTGEPIAILKPVYTKTFSDLEKNQTFLHEYEMTKKCLKDPKLSLAVYKSEKGKEKIRMTETFYAEGEFFDFIERNWNSLTLTQIMRIFAELVEDLEKIHNENIVHNDLKPENIFLLGGRVYIRDFDLARPADCFNRNVRVGTIHYSAPEKFRSNKYEIGKPSDVFSLALIICILLYSNLEENSDNYFCANPWMQLWDDYDMDDSVKPAVLENLSYDWAEEFLPEEKRIYHPSLHQLLMEMLHPHPGKRPDIFQIKTCLEKISSNLPADSLA